MDVIYGCLEDVFCTFLSVIKHSLPFLDTVEKENTQLTNDLDGCKGEVEKLRNELNDANQEYEKFKNEVYTK